MDDLVSKLYIKYNIDGLISNIELLKLGSNNCDFHSSFILAIYYMKDERDLHQALGYLERAALCGYIVAEDILSLYLQETSIDKIKKYRDSFSYYQTDICGETSANRMVTLSLKKERVNDALQILERLSLEYSGAMHKLAIVYIQGIHVTKDYKKAIPLLEKAYLLGYEKTSKVLKDLIQEYFPNKLAFISGFFTMITPKVSTSTGVTQRLAMNIEYNKVNIFHTLKFLEHEAINNKNNSALKHLCNILRNGIHIKKDINKAYSICEKILSNTPDNSVALSILSSLYNEKITNEIELSKRISLEQMFDRDIANNIQKII